MRTKIKIPEEELRRLHFEKGWSHQRLSIKYGVSPRTIRRRLKINRPERDEKFMAFTQTLAEMAKLAPDDFSRKQLNRLVHEMRVLRAMTDEQKEERVVESLRTGAQEVEEIMEDCGFVREETERLLGLMIEAGKVEKDKRGGVKNRGRRMKLRYILTLVSESIF